MNLTPTSQTLSLRDKQIGALMGMLQLKDASTKEEDFNPKENTNEPVWKILVYDRVGQDVLSPVLSIQDIRQAGVTLNIQLHSDRETIPDVPVVYFCLPSENNVDRICRDLKNGLYGPYYLNFITPISRQRIEDLANAAYESSVAYAGDLISKPTIQKVFDQYLNFICLEPDFFILTGDSGSSSGGENSINFYELNKPGIMDTEMNSMIDRIVDGLFSVCASLATVPIIKCPKGNAAEIVAEKLDKKLRDNLRDNRNSMFNTFSSDYSSAAFSSFRPVLIIYDRGMDLATPLHHTWAYQAMCHDVLSLHLNQVKFTEETAPTDSESEKARLLPGQNIKRTRTCDMDDRKDYFWGQYKGSPFPIVAEAIQNELEEYKKSEEEIKRLKQTMGLEELNSAAELSVSGDLLTDNTAKLTSAITSLPQLLEKKKILDNHTSIATAILHEIKTRHLDSYYEMESKLFSRTQIDMGLNNLLLDPDMGHPEDKLRFFLIYYLFLSMKENENSQPFSPSELDQYLDSFKSVVESSSDGSILPEDFIAPINFVKKWISYTKMAASISSSSSSSGLGSYYSSSSGMKPNNRSSSMLSKWVNTGSNFLMEGVRNLVLKKQSFPVTRLVGDVMDGTGKSEDLRTFDPKILKPNMGAVKTGSFQEAIVFVVGGGNYIEYQNLIDNFKSRNTGASAVSSGAVESSKRITYGCTNLCNAHQFLQQLSKLGKEM